MVEYYYTEFKRASYFSQIKEQLRDRERSEQERAMTEGAVTVRERGGIWMDSSHS